MNLSLALSISFALGMMMTPGSTYVIPNHCSSMANLGGKSVAPKSATFLRSTRNLGSWDNDDFLSSLSQPSEQSVVEDDIDPDLEGTLPPVPSFKGEHDANQGGSRFREMMAAAQRVKSSEQPRGQPPINPYAYNPFVPPANSSNQSLLSSLNNPTMEPVDFSKLSVEDQAAMFRQMMLTQPPGQQISNEYNPPPRGPPTMIGGVDAKGRKIGRNRDTDSIANTSDLYFAQLKRDSSVRNMARMQGDVEYAEKVFADPSVKRLGEELYQNPYLKREKEDTLDSIQAVAKEMQQIQIRQAAAQPDVKDMGPKYKAILEAKKKKISKPQSDITPQVVASTDTTMLPEPVLASPSVPSPAPAVIPLTTNVMASPTPPVDSSSFESVSSIRESTSTASPGATASTETTSSTAPAETRIQEEKGETESTKRQIRELQGLFLKHRGGPGFGSGRLRGKEIDQFESTLRAVGAQLRVEAGPRDQAMTSVAMPAAAPVLEMPHQVVSSTSESAPTQPRPTPSTEHKVAPIITPPPRPDTSAMTAFVASSVDPKIQASIACVEGAIQMYKNCDPDLQQGVLMMLRAAFLSAAKTCQNVMEGESSMYTTPMPATSFTSPFTAQDATIETPGEGTLVVEPIEDFKPPGTDINTVALHKVYNSLCAASGDGKYGLGPISSNEASDLSELVSEMRGILMEELESGIPEQTVSVASPDSSENESASTVSSYQQMLAKARAKKNTSA